MTPSLDQTSGSEGAPPQRMEASCIFNKAARTITVNELADSEHRNRWHNRTAEILGELRLQRKTRQNPDADYQLSNSIH